MVEDAGNTDGVVIGVVKNNMGFQFVPVFDHALHPDPKQHPASTENDRRTMASATLMFPDIANNEDVVQAFLRVVSSLELPQGTKRQHEDQMSLLERIMNIWAEDGKYDMELDPFLQYLRVNSGQGTLLPVLMVSMVREEDAEQARRLAVILAAPDVQAAHARDVTDKVKTPLRLYKRNMEAKQAFNCILTAPSRESSNDSDMDEGVYQI